MFSRAPRDSSACGVLGARLALGTPSPPTAILNRSLFSRLSSCVPNFSPAVIVGQSHRTMAKAKVSAAKPAASALAGLPLLTAAAAPHRAYLADSASRPLGHDGRDLHRHLSRGVPPVPHVPHEGDHEALALRRQTGRGARLRPGRWLADAETNPSKHHAEVFILRYSACWIVSVVVVIATAAYESWGKWGYVSYCRACAAPAVLYP